MKKLTPQAKKAIITRLIANEGLEGPGPWVGVDAAVLEQIPDDRLVAFDKQRELAANNVDVDDGDGNDEPTANIDDLEIEVDDEPTPVLNSQSRSPSPQEEKRIVTNFLRGIGLADADPREVRNAISGALSLQKQRKAKLIEKITANSRNKFDKKWLATRTPEELEGLAALATNEEDDRRETQDQLRVLSPNFSGVIGNMGAMYDEDFKNADQEMAPISID